MGSAPVTSGLDLFLPQTCLPVSVSPTRNAAREDSREDSQENSQEDTQEEPLEKGAPSTCSGARVHRSTSSGQQQQRGGFDSSALQ